MFLVVILTFLVVLLLIISLIPNPPGIVGFSEATRKRSDTAATQSRTHKAA